jgi:hypothetical protein
VVSRYIQVGREDKELRRFGGKVMMCAKDDGVWRWRWRECEYNPQFGNGEEWTTPYMDMQRYLG